MHSLKKGTLQKFLALNIITLLILQPVIPLLGFTIFKTTALELGEQPASYPVNENEITSENESEVIKEQEDVDPVFSQVLEGKKETFTNLTTNQTYAYSLNNSVTINFNSLQEGVTSFSVEEKTFEVDGVAHTGYEFLSNMVNGTFFYEMTLPNPFGTEVEVRYSEDGENFVNMQEVVNNNTVTLTGDHFTVFVVIPLDSTEDGTEPLLQSTVISPASTGNWYYSADSYIVGATGSLVEFIAGPDTPPLGTGSIRLKSGDIGTKAVAMTTEFDGVLLSDISDFGFDTYVTNRIGADLVPYVNVYVDKDNNGTMDARLDFDGSFNGGSNLNEWKSWDLLNANWRENISGTMYTIASYAAAFPGVKIDDPWNLGTGGIVINAGDTASLNYSEFDSNVDNFRMTYGATEKVFDFEPINCLDHAVTLLSNPTGCYATIQAAVDDAIDGDVLTVSTGTFVEQVSIGKNLVINGTTGIVVQAPATMVDSPVGASTKSVFFISNGANVTINDLTITGPGVSGCNSINYGAFVVGNAVLNLNSISVLDIRDEPISGCQNGIGLRAGSQFLGQVGTLNLDDVLVEGYQKGGIVVDNTGSSANIQNSVVTGAGEINFTAQNGIQISRGATGTVNNSAISGNSYNNPADAVWNRAGTGILLFEAGDNVTITNNTFYGNDSGIYFSTVELNPSVTGNSFDMSNFWFVTYDDADNIDMRSNNYPSFNINTLESKINHDCNGSPFAHGTCNADDFSVGGSVNYFSIQTPAPLTPPDGTIIQGIAFTQTWTSVSGAVQYEYQSCHVDPGDSGTPCSDIRFQAFYPGTSKSVASGQPDGQFWWRVRAQDSVGNWSPWSESFELIIDNTSPVVNSMPDQFFWEGDLIPEFLITATDNNEILGICYAVLDSSSNVLVDDCDFPVPVSEYQWSLNELLGIDSLPLFDTSIINEGTYTLLYLVFDVAANISEIEEVVFNLQNVVPTVTLLDDQTIDEGEEVVFTASFFDPSSLDSGDQIHDDADWTASVDYGDGSAVVDLGTFNDSGDIAIPNHAYADEGIYTVTLTVCESSEDPGEGECSTDTVEVTANNLLPSVSINVSPSTNVLSGTNVTLTAVGAGGDQPLIYEWSGDCSGTDPIFVLNTSDPRQYNCTVTVIDEDEEMASASVTITSTNTLPSVVIIANPGTNVLAGTTVTLKGNILGGDANFSYVWSGACAGNGTNGGGLTNATTVPNTPGSYFCRIDVTDANGDTAAAGVTVVVSQSGGIGGPSIAGEDTQDSNEDEGEDTDENVLGALTCDEKNEVSGFIYVDSNNNGQKEDTERTLSDIKVTVLAMIINEEGENEVIEVANVTTDENGMWKTDLCPGEYTVRIDSSGLPQDITANENEKGIIVKENEDQGNVNFATINNANLNAQDAGFNWLIILLVALIAGGLISTGYLFSKRQGNIK